MKTIEIKGSFRTELGKKSSKKTRKEGMYPALFMEKRKTFIFMLMKTPLKILSILLMLISLILNLEGKEYKVVLQDIQFHPVTDKITTC